MLEVFGMLKDNNGKRSTTRFAYFVIIIVAILIILSCCFVMIYDTLTPERTSFDYFTGIAQVILAAAALVLCAGVPKALTDRFNNKNYDKV